MAYSDTPHSPDNSVQDQVRDMEAAGIDAHKIDVSSPLQGSMAETQHTADQATKPLGRALLGFGLGLTLGLALGAIAALVFDFELPIGLLFGGIAGALLGGLNALYSRLPMSSTAFDADGASGGSVSVHGD